jgi:ABC-type nitrate/sulfonate/bicarbonate transport system substrate-binding protein
MREVGVLSRAKAQARLAKKVTYENFLGGPAVLEAFRAGALDLVTIGNTPPIQAQGAGERILIVAAWQLSGPQYGLAVRPGLKPTNRSAPLTRRRGFACTNCLLFRLAERHRPTVLMVTYGVDEVLVFADRVLVME